MSRYVLSTLENLEWNFVNRGQYKAAVCVWALMRVCMHACQCLLTSAFMYTAYCLFSCFTCMDVGAHTHSQNVRIHTETQSLSLIQTLFPPLQVFFSPLFCPPF